MTKTNDVGRIAADFAADIPHDLAQSAHRGTSFDPERRAAQERSGYASTLTEDYATLQRYVKTDEQRATLTEMFNAYRE